MVERMINYPEYLENAIIYLVNILANEDNVKEVEETIRFSLKEIIEYFEQDQ